MSKTKSVGCYDGPAPDLPDPRREMWVYDMALSLLLDDLIGAVTALPAEQRPAWWDDRAGDLRTQAVISDYHFDVGEGLDAAGREEFARLLEAAATRIEARGSFTADGVDERQVVFRGSAPYPAAPVAELGRALATLLRGPLPAPPPGTLRHFGGSEGRSTIGTV